jgi:MFS family permease
MDVKGRWRNVQDVCVQTVLNMLGIGIVVPILPIYASSFHINLTLVGAIVTAFAWARLFVNIPADRLTERVGFQASLLADRLILSGSSLLHLSSCWFSCKPTLVTLNRSYAARSDNESWSRAFCRILCKERCMKNEDELPHVFVTYPDLLRIPIVTNGKKKPRRLSYDQ